MPAGSPDRTEALSLAARGRPRRLAPGLYVVATPIGNLGDVSLRALTTLAAADAILAEDTRVTHRLLDRYDIATPLVAYHEHNAAEVRPRILARLAAGKRWRWSPTPARRSSPTPATSWWSTRRRRASRSSPCPARAQRLRR